jgi:transcriptional regulator with XRE-family HTH domain
MVLAVVNEQDNEEMIDHLTKLDRWRMHNPLRGWRVRHRLTQRTVAQLCRVSLTSVRMWESGTTSPSEENMAALARMMRTPEIDTLWRLWLNASPRV